MDASALAEHSLDGTHLSTTVGTLARSSDPISVWQADVAGSASSAASFSLMLDIGNLNAPGVALANDAGSSGVDKVINASSLTHLRVDDTSASGQDVNLAELPPSTTASSAVSNTTAAGLIRAQSDVYSDNIFGNNMSMGASTSDRSVDYASFASIPTLAAYLTNGYWAWAGGSAHHWASSTVSVNITDLTAAEQNLAINALELWHEVANISFTYTSGAANITYIDDSSYVAFTESWWSGSYMTSATIDISSNWWPDDNIYGYMFQTYLHETGHALGLGQQGPYNFVGTYGIDNIYSNDTWQWSIMSYFNQQNFGGTYDYVITPEMADIYAVQSIYGTQSTRSGDTTYGFHCNASSIFDFTNYSGTPAFTIYDSGGTDTLDCSGYSQNQIIDLTSGNWSSIGGYTNNIGIYLTSTIENAVGGSGNDTIIGNSANNTIDGGAGIDSVVFSGLRSAYTLTDLGNGSVGVSGPDGTDTLSNLEKLVFADQTVNWPPLVIESFGSTSLTEVGINFYLYNSSGSGPELKYAGAAVVTGEFGTWAPIGAELTTSRI